MTVANNPEISVIVTAFNRKEFLKGAIESILNQTLDRAKYEIIVTKNFSDPDIDRYMDENHVISIIDDVKGMGIRIAKAGEIAMGNIICFLQDDDYWLPEKLEHVMLKFNDPKLGVLRDEVFKVDGAGNILKSHCHSSKNVLIVEGKDYRKRNISRVFKYCGKGLMSALSVRRELFSSASQVLKNIFFTIDDWITYACLDSGFKYMSIPKELTAFRVHSNASRQIGNDAKLFSRNEFFLSKVIDDEAYMLDMIQDKDLIKFIRAERARNCLLLNMYGRDGLNSRGLLNNIKNFMPLVLINRNMSNKFLMVWSCILPISRNFAMFLYTELLRKGFSGSI